MVEARNSETGQRLHHVLMEIRTILLLETKRIRSQRRIVERRRYISIELIEIIQLMLRVHQPFGIAKKGNLHIGSRSLQAVELGSSHIEFVVLKAFAKLDSDDFKFVSV